MSLSEQQLVATLASLDPNQEPRVVFTCRAIAHPPKRLGILDASFNPPTRAHVRMLELASDALQFDERLLLLARSNVDKPVFGAPLLRRLQMMELLARRLPAASVGATAHARFVDKAHALRRLMGKDCSLFFILGFDTLVRLFDPKYYEDMASSLSQLFSLAEVVFSNRAGFHDRAAQEFLGSPPVKPFAARLHFVELDAPYSRMSSSEARRMLSAREAAADAILPPGIPEFIRQRQLYRE